MKERLKTFGNIFDECLKREDYQNCAIEVDNLFNKTKQEAIKCIKELEKEYFKELENPDGRNKAFYHEQQLRMTYLNAQMVWIKWFFNIAAEDLK